MMNSPIVMDLRPPSRTGIASTNRSSLVLGLPSDVRRASMLASSMHASPSPPLPDAHPSSSHRISVSHIDSSSHATPPLTSTHYTSKDELLRDMYNELDSERGGLLTDPDDSRSLPHSRKPSGMAAGSGVSLMNKQTVAMMNEMAMNMLQSPPQQSRSHQVSHHMPIRIGSVVDDGSHRDSTMDGTASWTARSSRQMNAKTDKTSMRRGSEVLRTSAAGKHAIASRQRISNAASTVNGDDAEQSGSSISASRASSITEAIMRKKNMATASESTSIDTNNQLTIVTSAPIDPSAFVLDSSPPPPPSATSWLSSSVPPFSIDMSHAITYDRLVDDDSSSAPFVPILPISTRVAFADNNLVIPPYDPSRHVSPPLHPLSTITISDVAAVAVPTIVVPPSIDTLGDSDAQISAIKNMVSKQPYACSFTVVMVTFVAVTLLAALAAQLMLISVATSAITASTMTSIRMSLLYSALAQTNAHIAGVANCMTMTRTAATLEVLTTGLSIGAQTSAASSDPMFMYLSLSTDQHPLVASAGSVNSHGVIIALVKTTSNQDVQFNARSGMIALISSNTTAISVSGSPYPVAVVYNPAPIHPAPPRLSEHADLHLADNATMRSVYIGQPSSVVIPIQILVDQYHAMATYQASAGNGQQMSWSDVTPMPLGSTDAGANSIMLFGQAEMYTAAVGAIPPPMTFAQYNLLSFSRIFDSLSLINSGVAYLVGPDGVILASSDRLYNYPSYRMDPTSIESNVAPILIGCGLASSAVGVNLRNGFDILPMLASPSVCTQAFTHSDTAYSLTAIGVAPCHALPLVIVIVSPTENISLKFAKYELIVGGISISLIAIIFCALMVRTIIRPIATMILYMRQIGIGLSLKNGPKKQQMLVELINAWKMSSGDTDILDMDGDVVTPTNGDAAGKHIGTNRVMDSTLSSSSGMCMPSHNGGSGTASIARPMREMTTFHRLTAPRAKRRSFMTCAKLQETKAMTSAFSSILNVIASTTEIEQINHAKRGFIRYIFHEVRVPFNCIVLGIEQLLDEMSPHSSSFPNVTDTLKILTEQTDVITHILNDTLSLQRIEDGALSLEYRIFHLESMLNAALHSFKAACADKNIRMKTNFRSLDAAIQLTLQSVGVEWIQQSPMGIKFGVLGDLHRLRQCCSNLMSNAIKFSSIGSIIRVRAEWSKIELSPQFISHASTDAELSSPFESLVGSISLTVTVADEGSGVPLAHRSRLFSAYSQIDARTSGNIDGAGLGLSLSKSLIELHGGRIGYATPRSGPGSEFFFKLNLDLYYMQAASSTSPLVVRAANVDRHSSSPESPESAGNGASHQRNPTLISPSNRSVFHPATCDGAKGNVDSPPSLLASLNNPRLSHYASQPMIRRQDAQLGETNATSAMGIGLRNKHIDIASMTRSLPSPMLVSRMISRGENMHHINTLRPPTIFKSIIADDSNIVNASSPIIRITDQSALPLSSTSASVLSSIAIVSNTVVLVPPPSSVSSLSSSPPSLSIPTPSIVAIVAAVAVKYRILVIEDSKPNRKLLCSLLVRLGCDVSSCENGQECVDMCEHMMTSKSSADLQTPTVVEPSTVLESSPPSAPIVTSSSPIVSPASPVPLPFDLLLMDNTMPIMDGVSATSIMRSRGMTAPIVGVTGNALQEDIDAFVRAGADRVLTKPITKMQLTAVIAQYCASSSMANDGKKKKKNVTLKINHEITK